MSQNYFCIFCSSKYFYKIDLKEHLLNEHKKNKTIGEQINGRSDEESVEQSVRFEELVESLLNYCSQLEITLGSSVKRRKRKLKYLPESGVNELLIGCRLCDQMINYYKLKTFDIEAKPFKDVCICGNTSSDNCLTKVQCIRCRHSLHFECYQSEEYSGQDLTGYLCEFCKLRDFTIERPNDMKPLEQLRHLRQHINYSPIKCRVHQTCGQKFYLYQLFVEHLKTDHRMTDESISNKQNSLYSFETINEVEELLGKKTIKSEFELMAVDVCEDQYFANIVTKTENNYNSNQISAEPVRCLPTVDVQSTAGSALINSTLIVSRASMPTTSIVSANESKQKPALGEPNVSLVNGVSDQLVNMSPSKSALNESNGAEQRIKSNYSIPKIKLPVGLTSDLVKDIDILIKIVESNQNLINDNSNTNPFSKKLTEIETQCHKLSTTDRNQIYLYISSNLPISKDIFIDRVHKTVLEMIEKRLLDAISALKQYINQLEPEILKKYNDSIKQFEQTKRNGIQSEVTIPLKVFPFDDGIKKALNDIIDSKVDYYDLVLSNDPDVSLKDYLYDYLQYKVLPIWPNGWMSMDRLNQKVKPIIKQKSPNKSLSIASLTSSPKSCRPNAPLMSMSSTVIIDNSNIDNSLEAIESFTPTTSAGVGQTNPLQTPNATQTTTISLATETTAITPSKTRLTSNASSESNEPLNKRRRLDRDSSLMPTPVLNSTENNSVIDIDLTPIASTSSANTPDCTENRYELRRRSTALSIQSTAADVSQSTAQSPPQTDLNNKCFEHFVMKTKIVKLPYFPQMGDKVVYLRSGHEYYRTCLRNRNLIKSTRNGFGSHYYSKKEFRDFDAIFAIVKDIEFQSKPFDSIKVNLEEVNPQTDEPMNEHFVVAYSLLEDNSDFLLLRQTYDVSISRNWSVGDQFRTALGDDYWNFGFICGESAFDNDFPTSLYKRFVVSLNPEETRMSAWDLEPLDPTVSDCTDYREISTGERLSFYTTVQNDWPKCILEDETMDPTMGPTMARDLECNSLENAFDIIMGTTEGIYFTALYGLFEDSELRPLYPINLSIIKDRIKNRFYRRSAQIKFDLEMMAKNVDNYLTTQYSAEIFQKCRLIKNVCIEFIETDFWQNVNIMQLLDKTRIQLFGTHTRLQTNVDTVPTIATNIERVAEEEIENCVEEELESYVEDEAESSERQEMKKSVEEESRQTETQIIERTDLRIEIQTQTDSELRMQFMNECETQTDTEIEPIVRPEAAHISTQTETQTLVQRETQTATDSRTETQTEISTVSRTELQSSTQTASEVDKKYICVFCIDKNFKYKKSAREHFMDHLLVIITCDECGANSINLKAFRSHIHYQSDRNLMNIKMFHLAIDWINSFLDFQLSDSFSELVRFHNHFCPICDAIMQKRSRDRNTFNFNPEVEDDSFSTHIRKHLNYNRVFECKQCDASEPEDDVYKYFFSSVDARTHMCSHDSSLVFETISDDEIESKFTIDSINNPNLEAFINRFIEANDLICDIYKNNSFD